MRTGWRSAPSSSTSPRQGRASGVAWAAGFATVLFALSWLRHHNYWSGFDLAIFDQAAWQLSEGRTHISIVDRHVLSDHFSPVVLLIGQLYRVLASPVVLLAVQAAALGATVVPLRALADHLGASPRVATALTVCSAPLWAAAMFDFHPSTLAVPFIAFAVLSGCRGRAVPAALATLGVALCRADLGIVLVAAALVARGRARIVLAVGGAVSVLAGVVGPELFGETGGWETYYSHLGATPVEAALQPWRLAGELLHPSSLATMLVWFLAAGAVGILAPRWTLAVVVAGLPIVMSRWTGTTLPWYHYGAPIAPLAIGGTLTVWGQRSLPSVLPERAWVRLSIVSVPLALLVASPFAPGAPSSFRLWSVVREEPGVDHRGAVEAVLPGEAVSAGHRVLPHLSQREELILFPLPFASAPEFYPFDTHPDLDDYDPDSFDVAVGRDFQLPPEGFPGFEVVERPDGYVVLRSEGSAVAAGG
jgi:uncharacterized membrane protein